MNIEPLNGRVVIQQDRAAEKSGGIFLPPSATEKPQTGMVVATTDDSQLEVGDKVLFGKFSGVKVEQGGSEYLIMKEEDLLGVLR